MKIDIDRLLESSTENITHNYFLLPIDGGDKVYRERVYCYELYHQLRCKFPSKTGYEISGEIDKYGHPKIRNNGLDRIKPDFLIHQPGNDNNLLIMEVKPITSSNSGIKKDLKSLTAFIRHANYKKAIYLFYGDGNIEKVLKKIKNLKNDSERKQIDINLIEIWWHYKVGKKAIKLNLNKYKI